jgi:two-component system, chemotaxis family, protein-glutamate methylesterase/glutaminase
MSSAALREGRPLGLKKGDTVSSAPSLRPKRAVALAASAGGLAALTEVLSSLPPDFAAPVLVLQHMDPNHRSWLAEILSRRAALPVVQVQGGERLEAGRVYVAPPDFHLLVDRDGFLSLSHMERVHFVRPSADLLFASLAESWGEGAIAVVLTGTGRDGSEGVRAIKQHGGKVIAQDEASAQFSGMPEAACRTGAVDQVLPLAGIASALMDLTSS